MLKQFLLIFLFCIILSCEKNDKPQCTYVLNTSSNIKLNKSDTWCADFKKVTKDSLGFFIYISDNLPQDFKERERIIFELRKKNNFLHSTKYIVLFIATKKESFNTDYGNALMSKQLLTQKYEFGKSIYNSLKQHDYDKLIEDAIFNFRLNFK